jgi:AcrR family transcriptional regulator
MRVYTRILSCGIRVPTRIFKHLCWSEAIESSSPTKALTPVRQKRGQQRVESLLAAAESVFADIGYDRATTNLIAKRAAASPGTLYQFFRNKQRMAEAIAKRYVEQIERTERQLIRHTGHDSVDQVIDRVIDTYLEGLRLAPAYGALLETAGISQQVSALRVLLVDTSIRRIAKILGEWVPNVSKKDLSFHAEICVLIFRGMLPILQSKNPRQRVRASEEVKQVISRYLAPILAATPSRKKP